jgi:hypothetical protein
MSASQSFHSDQSFTRGLLWYIIIILGSRSRKNLFKKHASTSSTYRFCFPHNAILFIIIAPKTRNRPVARPYRYIIRITDNLWYLLFHTYIFKCVCRSREMHLNRDVTIIWRRELCHTAVRSSLIAYILY